MGEESSRPPDGRGSREADPRRRRRDPWHAGRVSDPLSARRWLTLPEVAETIGLSPGRVHRLIEERQLLAVRRDGVLRLPAEFLDGDHPLPALKGTIIVLEDCGFAADDAMTWLLTTEESLGVAPLDALRAGRKAEVRRVAQALA